MVGPARAFCYIAVLPYIFTLLKNKLLKGTCLALFTLSLVSSKGFCFFKEKSFLRQRILYKDELLNVQQLIPRF